MFSVMNYLYNEHFMRYLSKRPTHKSSHVLKVLPMLGHRNKSKTGIK
jgi:hypothetical protein